ncbi:MAG: hypothetical protein Q8S00_28995 [Deltaproteobacteria bacterium]|nr:hypothetical protein [Deltaproteobacteria bacterium]MDZ4345968.1 DUF3226 domain-containing protein [Candidatus Binatia bacterium]
MAGRKILLVEGRDDEYVLKHLCGQRGVQNLDEITPLGSVERLLENFPVRLKESDIEALGVVIDADTDIAARWQSLRDRLRKAGYQNVPEDPVATGTILHPPPKTLLPRVGLWIMPDNQTRGILEDFLRFLVPPGSSLFSHVESSVATIPEAERRFSQLAQPKAVIHTWLAWQEDPGKPFGTAITAKFLDPNVAQVDVLVAWLKSLFFP